MKIYDKHFNGNEWFIISEFCMGIALILFLPKRFPRKVSLVFFMCGVYSGFLFDHSLSVEPVNFYDVNDASTYQFIDFVSYFCFGPYSYLFFYVLDYFNLKRPFIPLYILFWAIFSIIMEYCSHKMGVYHYRHGYSIFYSFPIYLIVLSSWFILYYWILPRKTKGVKV
jgi:hypothetical protein